MKGTIIALSMAIIIIGGAWIFAERSPTSQSVVDAHNVTIVDGKQIIEIKAKGGYSPMVSIAKAGVPTILRFTTKGTFDCSSSIRIPSLDITKVLPQSGATDIDIGSQSVATLQGTCGMGMYPFQVQFKS